MNKVGIFYSGWLLAFFAFTILLEPSQVLAVAGDEHWDTQFGVPGVTNNLYAIAINNNGVIYAGGVVPSGTLTNTPLNEWDGAQWSTPAVFYGANSSMMIADLAFVGNTLYVAGIFTNVNGVAVNGLARWDGTAWSNIGFSGTAYALAVDGGNLYVGGNFSNPGGVTATNIGYWDGSNWHALGSGLGSASSSVRGITLKSGIVYAGGAFSFAGPVLATNLAAWNGAAWTAVGGGVNGTLLSVAFNGANLYVTGFFSQAGAIPANNIAMWDGVNWNALGSGLGSLGFSLAVLNNTVCVAGSFNSAGGIAATNFAVWNGSSWSAAAGGVSASANRVISNGTNVLVGGNYAYAGNVFCQGIAAWDGARWSAIGTQGRLNGVQSTIFALANDGTNLYAGGFFIFAGLTNTSYIAKFDGTNWSPLGSGMGPAGGVTIVRALAVASNNVYAGGSFSSAGGVSAQNIACWDGSSWSALGNGPGGVVAAITPRTNGIYVAGAPPNGVNYGSPFFELWNGTSWQSALSLKNNNTFFSVFTSDQNIGMDTMAFLGTNIFLGGHFNFTQYDPNVGISPSTNCPNIMRLDAYGEIMGSGLNSNAVAMAVVSTNLYVAGLFTNAGGITASHIAMWNGNAWSAVGTGVTGSGTVNALTSMGNVLYAGGTFTNIGGVPANLVAKWDGTSWSALGNGLTGKPLTVASLGGFGTDLYAGGSFRTAGGVTSLNIARWNSVTNFDVPQLDHPALLVGRQFQARLLGVAGFTNIILATTNLTAWTPVLTNTVGVFNFIDPAGSPLKCYRAMLGP